MTSDITAKENLAARVVPAHRLERASDGLDQGLRDRGVTDGDIERVIALTHGHLPSAGTSGFAGGAKLWRRD